MVTKKRPAVCCTGWITLSRSLAVAGGSLLLLVVAALVWLPEIVERNINGIAATTRKAPSPCAQALHARLFIADLHADTLLWNRDLLQRGTRGHVDLPRLQEGNVALQAFTIVTKAPRGMNNERTDGNRFNLVAALSVLQLWPPKTWMSMTERALYQCRRLEDAAARSGGQLVVIRSRDDLRDFLARRASNPKLVGAFLGVEGAHALDGDLSNLDRLYAAGVRMMAPTHFFDNEIGGSAHGLVKGGLTEMGRELIRRMEQKGMIVDLAHASPAVIDDVLAMATRPVVISHTGVRGTCGGLRNITDDQLRGVARTGGVVGIGYFFAAVCGQDARSIARAMRYAANVAGVEHVALGSDYDGAVSVPFDTAHLAEITDALLEEGFSEAEIALMMGGNIQRVLLAALP
uniref:Peptidase M19 renal dipeptidase n=1 Tax=Chloracidobacterium thermophilum TaxID=458033 RepID=A8DJV4_9BACT|nr:peptidase M19 renal dipeptidase [Chloracidobacterium thermophilum]